MAEVLSKKLQDEHPEVAKESQTAAERIREAGKQTRALSHSLTPPAITEGDLTSGLHDLAKRQKELREFTFSVEVDGPVPTLHEETASHLYHIASEAIANAAQHADPDQIVPCLRTCDEHLLLTVRDDGVGIPERSEPSTGAGVHLMDARADVIGADGGAEKSYSMLAELSDRELEVFEYLGRGLTSREIAKELNLSPKTVATYWSRAKVKLGLDSNAELQGRAVVWLELSES